MEKKTNRGAFLEEVSRELTWLCSKYGIDERYGEFKDELLQAMAKHLKASFANGIKLGKQGRGTQQRQNRS